jgi:chemotaxis-related protein WspD
MTGLPADRAGPDEPPVPDCWRRIGTDGDRTCPELATFVHCRNCPVVAAAARRFFERPAPAGYLESWHAVLEHDDRPPDADTRSVLVFRLGKEWLGLRTSSVSEVVQPRRIHRLPHRTGGALGGIVNVHGRLHPCIDLARVLGIEQTDGLAPDGSAARMLVVGRGRRLADHFVLDVDEVSGLASVARAAVRAVPATVGREGVRGTTGLFAWREVTVGLLDEDRLFVSLEAAIAG